MKSVALPSFLAGLAVLAAGCGSVQESKVKASTTTRISREADDDDADDADDDADESEEPVALDAVPAAVLAAARAAVPGITLSSAEREVEHGATQYCLHGTVAGERVEVEISPSGAVLEIEHGDDEEDD